MAVVFGRREPNNGCQSPSLAPRERENKPMACPCTCRSDVSAKMVRVTLWFGPGRSLATFNVRRNMIECVGTRKRGLVGRVGVEPTAR